jgi:hypothetical protein
MTPAQRAPGQHMSILLTVCRPDDHPASCKAAEQARKYLIDKERAGGQDECRFTGALTHQICYR